MPPSKGLKLTFFKSILLSSIPTVSEAQKPDQLNWMRCVFFRIYFGFCWNFSSANAQIRIFFTNVKWKGRFVSFSFESLLSRGSWDVFTGFLAWSVQGLRRLTASQLPLTRDERTAKFFSTSLFLIRSSPNPQNFWKSSVLIHQYKIMHFYFASWGKRTLELFCLWPNTIGWRQNTSSSGFASWGKIVTTFWHF